MTLAQCLPATAPETGIWYAPKPISNKLLQSKYAYLPGCSSCCFPPHTLQNGCCRRQDACPFAHGVFECWLHPSRYRTQVAVGFCSCTQSLCTAAHNSLDQPSASVVTASCVADAPVSQIDHGVHRPMLLGVGTTPTTPASISMGFCVAGVGV